MSEFQFSEENLLKRVAELEAVLRYTTDVMCSAIRDRSVGFHDEDTRDMFDAFHRLHHHYFNRYLPLETYHRREERLGQVWREIQQ